MHCFCTLFMIRGLYFVMTQFFMVTATMINFTESRGARYRST
uniref:Uncharacterized protein n=1 Tax=Triticum urartu TaxID=4572 RepID=A0A8R7P8L1_TRIUA